MIINSLLDTDWYKLLMGQVVWYKFSDLWVKYKFYNRSDTWFPEGFADKLKEEVNNLSILRLTSEEKNWLLSQKGMTKYYVDWFEKFSFNPNQVKIEQIDKRLSIEIEGKWKESIYWEVPLLAIISELYYKETNCKFNTAICLATILQKQEELHFSFADFGTRRRFSYEAQDLLVLNMKNFLPYFMGTSNPYLAMKYNVRPVGTTAHETVMAMSALYGVRLSNSKWIENWRFIYGNNYNVALTDTFTTKYFFETVPQKDLLLIEGLRQDSGNPEEVGAYMIAKWKERQINPLNKKIIFSDNLNPKKAKRLYETFKDKTNVIFGIGTNLTNDCGYTPLNIVIKLDSVLISNNTGGWNWNYVIKLSDDKRKYTGCEDVIKEVEKEIE